MKLSRPLDHHREPSRLIELLVGVGLLWSANAYGSEYYVATTGTDANPGTITQPFATLQKAANIAVAGDTVWIRGGRYNIVTPATSGAGINVSKSGTSSTNRIRFWAYPGELPVFDFSRMVISTTGYTVGISVSGSWLHFKGLEICNVPMNTRSNSALGVNAPAHDDIFELLDIHHNKGAGMFISHGTGGHLILNSDSHDNYDPTSHQGDGQNADGFGVHYQDSGAVTTFRGCRAWWNSDDGWDLISQEVPVIIENSWAMGNGYIKSGTARPADGNGNGFKAGSSKTGIRHIVRSNLAWGNAAAGFYANHSSGGNDWFNNTAYSNGTQFNLLASTWDSAGNRKDGVILSGSRAHKMRNNIGFPNKNSYVNGYGVDTAFNSWELGISPATSHFAGVDATGAMGPRQPDGSLPDMNFMKLRGGSPMIDKGTNVGLAYVGSAPDLGAYEYGAFGGSPSGGASSVGGGTSLGGAASTGGVTSGSTGGESSNGGAASTIGGAPTAGGTTTHDETNTGGNPNTSTGTGGKGSDGSTLTVGGASGPHGSTSAVGGVPPSAPTPDEGPSDAGSCGCRVPSSKTPSRSSIGSIAVLGLALAILIRRKWRRLKSRCAI